MKMPQKPKPLGKIFEEKVMDHLDLLDDKETQDLTKRYNEQYVHWDELRYKDLPKDHEIVWALMKLSRNNQSKHVKFKDINLEYNMTNQSQRIIHILDTGASGLLVVDDPLKEPEMARYVVSSLMEEAIASSQLEGAVTTTKVAKQMLRAKRKPRSPSEQMIVNDYLTMQRIKEIRDQTLTIDTILELHKLVVHDTLEDPSFEGRFREDDETVVADPLESDRIFRHPPSHKKIPEYMETLCKFANDEKDSDFQHPLVKAIIIHFMIGYIHPFVDGNGRLARALMYWYALKRNYWLFQYMAISKVIKQSKGKYGLAYLYSETDNNDITYFINYNLSVMEKALENTRQYIARKQREQKDAMMLVESHPELNFRQAEILKDMIKHKGEPATVAEIMSKFNVVHQTARTDLQLLSKLGFLKMSKIGRTWYFFYQSDDNYKNEEKNTSRE